MNASQQTWSTSSVLIDGIKQNHAESWDRFVEVYTPLIYYWGREKRLSPQDSHDLVQDVFRSVIQAIPYYRPDSFRGWLWTMTQNRIVSLYRMRKNEDPPVGGSAALVKLMQQAEPSSPSLSDSQILQKSEHFLLQKALEMIRVDFQEKTWKAFWMTAVEGRSSTDVGDDLRLSPSTVRNAKLRVLDRLRDVLKQL